MSYMPENQDLKEPIKITLEGLDRIADGIDFRLEDHSRWSETHLLTIKELRKEIVEWQFKLRRLE